MTAHQKQFPLAGSHFALARHGQSGATVSELLPHIASIADKLCFVKSMHTEAINHDPGGHLRPDRIAAGRPAVDRVVAVLRPRLRQRQPAGVHRAAVASARGRPAALLAAVGQRLPAVAAPGRAVPPRQGPGPLPRRSRRPERRDAPPHARHLPAARGGTARARARPRDQRPHRAVRDGVPDADLGAGGDGLCQRAAERARHVRPRGQDAGHASRPTACWRGGSPSATCASSSSITRAGTSTATCPRTSGS